MSVMNVPRQRNTLDLALMLKSIHQEVSKVKVHSGVCAEMWDNLFA
jgi:hypothetical protein